MAKYYTSCWLLIFYYVCFKPSAHEPYIQTHTNFGPPKKIICWCMVCMTKEIDHIFHGYGSVNCLVSADHYRYLIRLDTVGIVIKLSSRSAWHHGFLLKQNLGSFLFNLSDFFPCHHGYIIVTRIASFESITGYEMVRLCSMYRLYLYTQFLCWY